MKVKVYLLTLAGILAFCTLYLTWGNGEVRSNSKHAQKGNIITIKDPKQTSVSLKSQDSKKVPKRMQIPILNVDAPIGEVGLSKDGAMDTIPKANIIAWYKPGSVPGQEGNSLLAGHRDWKKKLGSFFYLDKLIPGDKIIISFSDKSSQSFEVVSKNIYNKNNVPPEVMKLDGRERTTLITCYPPFKKDEKQYQNRLIVIIEKAF
jgi:LPXTG-site transpeptidase (sortase) family protein